MENLEGRKWRVTENGLARWVETMYILSLVDLHFLEQRLGTGSQIIFRDIVQCRWKPR